jgi:hypothetical protein
VVGVEPVPIPLRPAALHVGVLCLSQVLKSEQSLSLAAAGPCKLSDSQKSELSNAQ